MRLTKNPDINQMVFLRVIVFFFLIVFPSVGFTPSWNNSYCVFFVGYHLITTSFSYFFRGWNDAISYWSYWSMSHKQYIMYMYEHRYRFFSSYRLLEWKLHMANGGSWHTKRIGAGLLYFPIFIFLKYFYLHNLYIFINYHFQVHSMNYEVVFEILCSPRRWAFFWQVFLLIYQIGCSDTSTFWYCKCF